MNVPRYKNFILSHFKSLEHNQTLLCRDPLFISSVEVDCKQSLSSFITIFCAKKGCKKIEVRAMSDEASSRELRCLNQGGKRLGAETSSPLFKRCVMRRRTGTSALSALPVRLVAGKIYLSTNRKSHFLSIFFSQPCTMIKTFFHSPGSPQLTMLMSPWTLVNLFHSKFPKNALNLRLSNACSCRKT